MDINMRRKLEKEDRTAEDGVVDSSSTQEPSDLRGDEKNIAILFFLYLLQGIPLGLCGSIPMLLQNRGVSYRQQVYENFLLRRAVNLHIVRQELYRSICDIKKERQMILTLFIWECLPRHNSVLIFLEPA